jgi:hypothetical protein
MVFIGLIDAVTTLLNSQNIGAVVELLDKIIVIGEKLEASAASAALAVKNDICPSAPAAAQAPIVPVVVAPVSASTSAEPIATA